MPVDTGSHQSQLPVGICDRCRHLNPGSSGVGMACAAFPYGIPFAVRAGIFDHHNPHPGDRGIQFEPLED